MNHHHSLQTLSFERVEYPVHKIKQWLGYTDLDCFVFDSYFPATHDAGRPILLCAFARNSQPGYYNPYDPDLLASYPGETLVLTGPLKMTGNLVTADDMRHLLESTDPLNNFVLFSPSLDENQQVRYTIRPFRRTSAGDIFDGGSITTNPSPPATAMKPTLASAAVSVL